MVIMDDCVQKLGTDVLELLVYMYWSIAIKVVDDNNRGVVAQLLLENIQSVHTIVGHSNLVLNKVNDNTTFLVFTGVLFRHKIARIFAVGVDN